MHPPSWSEDTYSRGPSVPASTLRYGSILMAYREQQCMSNSSVGRGVRAGTRLTVTLRPAVFSRRPAEEALRHRVNEWHYNGQLTGHTGYGVPMIPIEQNKNTCQPSVRSVEHRMGRSCSAKPSAGQSRRVAGPNKKYISWRGNSGLLCVRAGGCTAADHHHQQLRQKREGGEKLTLAHPRNDTAADEDHTHLDDLEREGVLLPGGFLGLAELAASAGGGSLVGEKFLSARSAPNPGPGARDFEIWVPDRAGSGGRWGVHL